jgi:hypothetical protein
MPELEPNASAEGKVKLLLAWASTAYACGFVIVTLHTWRLHLPVIELLHPIYVWIGLPLAVVAFFFEHIASAFRKRSARFAYEVRDGWAQAVSALNQEELNLAASFIGMIKALPGLGGLLSVPFIRAVESLSPLVQKIDNNVKSRDPKLYEKTAKYVHRALGVFRIQMALSEYLGFLINAALICLGLAFYVWEVYPRIPQSLGGGRPVNVTLVADASVFPTNLASELQLRSSAVTPLKGETVNFPVTLLYLTKDAYFVQTKSGARMSINTAAVKSVIWQQPLEQLGPEKERLMPVR